VTTGLIEALSLSLVAVFAWFGWRMMKRANREKASALAAMVGKEVSLSTSGLELVLPTNKGSVVRVDKDVLVLHDRDSEERVIPLAAIRYIWDGNRWLGPW
jgi:hypothetical protein